ncbi:cell filamentation protein Fic [Bacteroidia bacterium]|nr:cell filamentation protein Fic [Bacteroidia bacterium]
MNDFDEYIRQGEPDKKEKGFIWQTAIGLQQVDGLKPSAYLIETAKQNIEGDITFDEVKKRIDTYYKTQSVRQNDTDNDRTEEADKVSSRIAEILSEKTFSFSPAEYLNIHRRLFTGIYKFAGKIRDYNITKSEWVLNGETVLYASADSIRATLEYDFGQEKSFDYKEVKIEDFVRHISKFVSGLWQIHAFGEGNTRTTAVFTIKYLRSFSFEVTNSLFAEHSWYFRNALVRANYNNFKLGVQYTSEFLERFFRNLLLGENNTLKNRELHINFQSAREQEKEISKSNICTLNCTLEEKFVLDFLKDNPKATQKEIAENIRKSERTVKTITSNLQQKNLLERRNGKRDGFWEIKN